MSKKAGLGRGLSALINNDANLENLIEEKQAGEMVLELGVEAIAPNPYQPRKEFPAEELQGLADSIKAQGLLQPIVVRKKGSQYELVAGERRLRAAKLAGLEKIPALVRKYNDTESMNLALMENLQRQDLNPIEVANAYSRLMNEGGMTQDELSAKLGVSRSAIGNSVRLLSMPEEVQEYVRQGKLSESAARAIAGLPNVNVMKTMAKDAAENGFTTRMVEKNVGTYKAMLAADRDSKGNPLKRATQQQKEDFKNDMRKMRQAQREAKLREIDQDLAYFVDCLELASGERVEVVPMPGGSGRVIGFKFVTGEDLQRVYKIFSKIVRESKREERAAVGAAPKKLSV